MTRFRPHFTPCAAIMAAAGALAAPPTRAEPPLRDTMPDSWLATDGLGRTLPGAAESGPPRAGKTVAIFYFLWQAKIHEGSGPVHDISKILAADPAAPKWGPLHAFHWWAEPRLGYYRMDDPFVIRKHAQMLADAGVDVIVCDATNALTYPKSYLAICRTYAEMRRQGNRTPQVAFILHAKEGQTAQKLYDEFYAKNLHPDLWFRWKGKPLLLAKPDNLAPALRDFFTLRESWAWTPANGWFGDGRDKWTWLDHTPQKPGWHESQDKPEQVPVAVAEHPTGNIGRSFQGGKEPPEGERAPEKGRYFAEQWARAREVDPELVFVTGWNEWIAQRFESGQGGGPGFLGRRLNPGETFFVDQYNPEFSRDIEPVRGLWGDAYYYQLVGEIRRYKGVRPAPKPTPPKSVRIDGPFSQWEGVGPEYRDDVGDTAHRNHPGWGTTGPYVNRSGRNDFEALKLARDTRSVAFYARCAAPITPATAEGTWMTLLLDTDGDRATGWEGYDFVVRRMRWQGKEQSVLCRNVGGGWRWEPVAVVPVRVAGREMHLSVPRAALGLKPGAPLRLRFKWVDNVPESGDILDLLDQGDAAPNGRFQYPFAE